MGLDIAQNLGAVQKRVEAACARAGRSPDEVTLIAVSKTWPTEVLHAALDAGALHLGENRAQELAQKASMLASRDVRWHFVGHLQSNKVRLVVGTASLIHSVDRFGLAESIARRASALGSSQDVLIEVNVSGERTKGGIEPGRCLGFAGEVASLEGVNLRGLMTMAPRAEDAEDSRRYFAALRDLRDDLVAASPASYELSMGMTQDFEIAIEEGATLIRVGEAVFGPRG